MINISFLRMVINGKYSLQEIMNTCKAGLAEKVKRYYMSSEVYTQVILLYSRSSAYVHIFYRNPLLIHTLCLKKLLRFSR